MSQLSLLFSWHGWSQAEKPENWPAGSGWELRYSWPGKKARIVFGIAYTYLVLDRASGGLVWEFLHIGEPYTETLALADRALVRLLAETPKNETGGSACLAS